MGRKAPSEGGGWVVLSMLRWVPCLGSPSPVKAGVWSALRTPGSLFIECWATRTCPPLFGSGLNATTAFSSPAPHECREVVTESSSEEGPPPQVAQHRMRDSRPRLLELRALPAAHGEHRDDQEEATPAGAARMPLAPRHAKKHSHEMAVRAHREDR